MRHLVSLLGIAMVGLVTCRSAAHAADVDLAAGVLGYSSQNTPFVANALVVSLANDTYTLADPAEAIALGANAVAAGCAPVDATTVTCPAAAVASFAIFTRGGNDSVTLTGVAAPAVVTGGDGNDTLIGGDGGDTFVWNPGDDDDVIDGGPGVDALDFNGAAVAETFTVTAAGAGFDFARDVANVHVHADATELLRVATFGGTDKVKTTPLVHTTQFFTANDAVLVDTLELDVQGGCAFGVPDGFEILDRQPVVFSGFAFGVPVNAVCGGILDLTAGLLRYDGTNDVANALTVTRVGDDDVFTDTAEPAISFRERTLDSGCVRLAANSVACPRAEITSIFVSTGNGNDVIDLGEASAPATVRAGDGDDTVLGGAGDDTFVWNPGDDNDVFDGGPGTDTLTMNGANVSEAFGVTADGTGFELTRNVAAVRLHGDDIEVLSLVTQGGTDTVSTTTLPRTKQVIAANTPALDFLFVDAHELCPTQHDDQIEFPGRPPIQFSDFGTISTGNVFCRPDPCAGAVATDGCTVNGVRNQLCQGTDANDSIVGTAGSDVILAGGGRDKIRAGLGDDLVCAGAGDDLVIGGRGNDTLIGGPGADRLRGDSGDDTLLGDDDDDQLTGGSGLDDLDGGLGDDRLRAGAGADVLRGGDGKDTIDGGSADDVCRDSDQTPPFKKCELP